MGRVAFVTGATGFVGRHLIAELAAHEWKVRALVRTSSATEHLREIGAELHVGTLADAGVLARCIEGSDTVFHLAAVTVAKTEEEYVATNATGTRALVVAVQRAKAPPRALVYLSSYAAGGPARNGRPRMVSAEPAPLTAYGRSKLTGEYIVRDEDGSATERIIVRAPAVYGPGDRALLPYFRLLRRGIALVPGGGNRRLQLILVTDLARALRRAADARSGICAVANPTPYAWDEIVGVIAQAMGRRPLRVPLPPPLVRAAAGATEAIGRFAGRAVPFNREKAEEMLAPEWTCDLAGSEALLPADDATPLQEGIEQTIRWYMREGWL